MSGQAIPRAVRNGAKRMASGLAPISAAMAANDLLQKTATGSPGNRHTRPSEYWRWCGGTGRSGNRWRRGSPRRRSRINGVPCRLSKIEMIVGFFPAKSAWCWTRAPRWPFWAVESESQKPDQRKLSARVHTRASTGKKSNKSSRIFEAARNAIDAGFDGVEIPRRQRLPDRQFPPHHLQYSDGNELAVPGRTGCGF